MQTSIQNSRAGSALLCRNGTDICCIRHSVEAWNLKRNQEEGKVCISKVCIGELLHHDHEKNLRDLSSKTSGWARLAKAKRGARALRAPRGPSGAKYSLLHGRAVKNTKMPEGSLCAAPKTRKNESFRVQPYLIEFVLLNLFATCLHI